MTQSVLPQKSRPSDALAVRACAICGARRYKQWWHCNGYDIGRCTSCGLVQVLQELGCSELGELYGEDYYNGSAYTNYLANMSAKVEYFGQRLDSVCKRHSLRPGRLLEVGCAFGLGLVAARERGWVVAGIELSVHAAEYGRSRFGLNIKTHDNALSQIEPRSQDLIVMWDVIEHLANPIQTLKEVSRILAREGVLVLATGDVGSIGARIYGRRWYLVSPPYHLLYFDRASISRALSVAGLEVKCIASEGHPLENMGRYPLLQWIARKDRFIGWRLRSGPVMEVSATLRGSL